MIVGRGSLFVVCAVLYCPVTQAAAEWEHSSTCIESVVKLFKRGQERTTMPFQILRPVVEWSTRWLERYFHT